MNFNKLTEAYLKSNTSLKAIKRARYIYFIDDNEAYIVDPYKQVNVKRALGDKELTQWIPCDLVIGEDVLDLMPEMKNIDPSTWYVANDSIPGDHIHRALVGYKK
jgi:hypothetical protein